MSEQVETLEDLMRVQKAQVDAAISHFIQEDENRRKAERDKNLVLETVLVAKAVNFHAGVLISYLTDFHAKEAGKYIATLPHYLADAFKSRVESKIERLLNDKDKHTFHTFTVRVFKDTGFLPVLDKEEVSYESPLQIIVNVPGGKEGA